MALEFEVLPFTVLSFVEVPYEWLPSCKVAMMAEKVFTFFCRNRVVRVRQQQTLLGGECHPVFYLPIRGFPSERRREG